MVDSNQMTFQEVANILKELGIHGITDEAIRHLEDTWNIMPPEVLDSMNKTAMLLTILGRGSYDYNTGIWTPKSSQVYSFDVEGHDRYTIFLQGILSISNNEFEITQILEDTSQVDYNQGTGMQTISFYYNGNPYMCEVEVNHDWFNEKILYFMNEVFEKEKNLKQLFFMGDGYQECIVFYCTEGWAQLFTKKTGCPLYNKE